MTSTKFEELAKYYVAKEMKSNFNIEVNASELELVWFAHELGNKKCTIWGNQMGEYYAEVTYNNNFVETYVDIYCKVSHTSFVGDF